MVAHMDPMPSSGVSEDSDSVLTYNKLILKKKWGVPKMIFGDIIITYC